jgi:kynurenine formamidase
VGHITAQPMSVHQCLRKSLIPATLITVLPVAAAHTPEAEHYTPALAPEDLLITRAALEQCAISAPFHRALVIRTLPNDTSKTNRDYMAQHPPFFTLEAMAYIAALGVEHLVVDMPSVDRLFDEGMLSNHHVFWNIPQGTHTPTAETRLHATITEFAYIPDAVADGQYVLELQIAAFESDAAPSRPFLWAIEE